MADTKTKLPESERNAFTVAYGIWTKYREAKTEEDYKRADEEIKAAIKAIGTVLQSELLTAIWNAIPDAREDESK